MRRTKEWWTRLTIQERRRLVELELPKPPPYIPTEDCPECDGCGWPYSGSRLCRKCQSELAGLIVKAAGSMTEKSCDDCNHAAVCRFLEGTRNLRFFGVDTKGPHEAVQKLKQELAARCNFFSGG